MKYFLCTLFVIFYFIQSSNLLAQEIKLGMSSTFTGPSKNLGLELKQGAELYFSQYNKTIEGRKRPIKLISYDDGYEPNVTILNTKKLIEQDKVFALFGYVGTPTSKAIMPLIKKSGIIYFSPFTGAEFLRSPIQRNIFNIRTSYYDEAETQVNYFIKQLKLEKVALFIQADEFGLSASKGYIKALTANGINNFEQFRYKRNSSDIKNTAEKLHNLNPDVIFCIGTYQPISELINSLRASGNKSKIVMLSFAGAMSLQQKITNFEDVFITSVMPDPNRSNLNIVKQYRQAMAEKTLTSESLEGYIDAAFFVHIINEIPGDITKEKFIAASEKLKVDIDGIPSLFSINNHHALNKAFLYRINQHNLIKVESL